MASFPLYSSRESLGATTWGLDGSIRQCRPTKTISQIRPRKQWDHENAPLLALHKAYLVMIMLRIIVQRGFDGAYFDNQATGTQEPKLFYSFRVKARSNPLPPRAPVGLPSFFFFLSKAVYYFHAPPPILVSRDI